MELYKASNQWAMRPPDERFWTVEEMVQACLASRQASAAATVAYRDLRVEARDGDLALTGRTGVQAALTNWAMGQLCNLTSAPASYLRTLPSTLAAQNLNYGLKYRADKLDADPPKGRGADPRTARLLFQRTNGPDSLVLRAATSQRYTRIWNHEIGERLLALTDRGWKTPPAMPSNLGDSRARPATEADCGPHTYVRVGDIIGPAGVYASDHDMFVFLIDPERQIADGSDDGLFRGFFCWNSEVGAASFGVMAFLFKSVCSNHIVWGAQGVYEIRVRHIGKADEKAFGQLAVELRKYADSSASDIEAKIEAAQRYVLGDNKEDVVEELFGLSRKARIQIPQKTMGAAYDLAERRTDDYGDPNTLWGMVNGMTQLSQEQGFADKRVEADRAAGKLLELAF